MGAVGLRPGRAAWRAESAASPDAVLGLGSDVDATLEWAARIGREIPLPGSGRTVDLWQFLAETSRVDVAAARILEPHLDALAILAEARAAGIDTDGVRDGLGSGDDATWGVFAAEGPGTRLVASKDIARGWRLDGTKPWCSLAGRLTHALVTAWVAPDQRQLFAVPLRAPGVTARSGPWVSRGLSQVVSAPVEFSAARAVPIGDPGWYLTRPGFAWGGMGVAAAWWGGTIPLQDALVRAAAREDADQLAFFHAGKADAALWAARAVLSEAADLVDAPKPVDDIGAVAARVRSVTADAVELVLHVADRALGPGPLTTDEEHARRVADLRVYVRQHHAERDVARLGRRVTA
ncbi:acyl-CoA dehydrogenase [Microbacterium sp. SS28]|uniref:acyl-CoA dehydrogenase n=1 Tax=Microbacterium sp. SS28 TaxID=2919948 RepID=UPI001FAB326E|nr:acyl-CoA dehydrogenase [Microbacterium sp. SS28]